MINAQQLSAGLGVNLARVLPWVEPINNAMTEFGITTSAQVSAFIAQIGHESGRLQFVREIWNPKQCPWQAKYEGRADLGNNQAGDGKRYMGRGLIQITGRHNYQECGDALGVDFVAHPELLEVPTYAARSAAWFWVSHGCNAVADAGNFRAVTRIINGGYNGYDDRLALLQSVNTALA